MNRYHSPRRSSSSAPAGPIVAFLLIACFGLLFVTGCSKSISGPEATPDEDETFTADDIARFRALNDKSDQPPVMAEGETASTASTAPTAALPARTASGTTSAVAVNPELRKLYDQLRALSSGKGGNVFRVTNAFLNVRSQPSVNAPYVARLNQGDLVSLDEFVNASWAKIALPGGQHGYVANRYLSKLTTEEKLKDEQKAFEGQYFVNFAFVNVRTGPQTGSEKIGEIPGQAFVRPLGIDKGWARVPLADKQGYVSMEFLSSFQPNFLVRQDKFTLPILHYSASDSATLATLSLHLARLKQDGVKFLTMRSFFDTLQAQEGRDVRISPRSVILAVSGITSQNVKRISDVLSAAGVSATLFVQTDQVGLSGISEKMLLTLQANGYDIQSGGHMGDDLRTLTTDQTKLELEQSRTILEQMTHKTVFAVVYPQGGANDRILQQAAEAGYLFGIGSAPDKVFGRDQFLRLPSYTITSGMTADDVLMLTK